MTKSSVPNRGNGSGVKLAYGQLHLMPHRAGKSAPPGAFRKFAEKNLPTPETVLGQKRQTMGALHPYRHRQKLCDEKNTPEKFGLDQVEVHPGTTDKQRANIDPVSGSAKNILTQAGRLGRPKG